MTTHDTSTDLFVVKPTAGKGLGVFAIKELPKGTRLTCEKALLIAPREPGTIDPLTVYEAFEGLSQADQNTYLGLSASEIQTGHALACIDEDVGDEIRNHVARISSIFESNAFNVGDEDIDTGTVQAGVFPLAARFNHDCKPNVAQTWNSNLQCLTMHTVQHISIGEELCDSYVPLCQPSVARKEELRAYGFDCQCSVCGASNTTIAKSDDSRRMVHRLGEDVSFYAQRAGGVKLGPVSPSMVKAGQDDPLNVIQYIEYLLEEEGLVGHDLIQYYAFAASYCSQRNPEDLSDSFQWQQKLFDVNQAVKGLDHEDTISAKMRLDRLRKLS